MKNLVKGMIAAYILAAAGSASANWFDCVTPVIGMDYYQVWMRVKNNFASVMATRSRYPGFTFYVGARLSECFGVELGYENSSNKTRNFHFTNGRGFDVEGNVKVRRSGTHLDFIAYIPLDCINRVEMFGSLGYGYLQPKVKLNIIGTRDSNIVVGSETIKPRNSGLLRAGVGVNYMITDCLGLRIKSGFEYTSTLKSSRYSIHPDNKFFWNSATLALGVFSKF